MGHYRSILESIRSNDFTIPNLINFIAMISLLLAAPLARWEKASQVVIEKGKGHFIENFRIIQLVEADLNYVLNSIWGRRLIQHAMRRAALDPAQYALPGQTCNNAVMNTMLFLDLSRQSLSPGVLFDFDASAAFDRVLAGLSILTCQRVGLPRIAGLFMFNLLHDMSFHLITGLGMSSVSYDNTIDNITGQGVLQGCSSAAPIFILNSDIALASYRKLGHGAVSTNPIDRTTTSDIAVQFVDDTSHS